MALVLALLLSLLLADASLLRSTCVDVGICQACEASELEEEYCRATGKRLEMRCNGRSSSAEETDFRSCMATPSDEMVRVVVFQACMAIIGGFALWGAQIRKRSNQTLFDNRKQRRPQRV